MCVIIAMPPGVRPSKELLQNCYDNNDDGWGFMFNAPHGPNDRGYDPEAPAIWSMKNITAFNDFWENFQKIPDNASVGVHFRIRTHGLVNKENCHPFIINSNLGMMHNGVVSVPTPTAGFSDTWHFVENDVKALLGPRADCDTLEANNKEILDLLEKVAGSSRLMFLDRHGRVLVTNQSSWHKHVLDPAKPDEFIYLSNSHSHLPKEKKTYDGYSWAGGGYRSGYTQNGCSVPSSMVYCQVERRMVPKGTEKKLPATTTPTTSPSATTTTKKHSSYFDPDMAEDEFFMMTDLEQLAFIRSYPESVQELMYTLKYTPEIQVTRKVTAAEHNIIVDGQDGEVSEDTTERKLVSNGGPTDA